MIRLDKIEESDIAVLAVFAISTFEGWHFEVDKKENIRKKYRMIE